ncbi:hypothetical protein TIFTF001_000593 [Ficus carica]|uniref:Uncharacterized protein n=1 Tax=Ficus carica TaxID=3494 RepID=A0AA87Z571_FICCA|nr:hypothetical protein TIFTF001_000593 [Ficus carica]
MNFLEPLSCGHFQYSQGGVAVAGVGGGGSQIGANRVFLSRLLGIGFTKPEIQRDPTLAAILAVQRSTTAKVVEVPDLAAEGGRWLYSGEERLTGRATTMARR